MGELVLKEKNLNSICDTMNGDNLNWDAINRDAINQATIISEDILRENTRLSCPSPLPDLLPVNVEDPNYICAIGYDERGRRIEFRGLDTHPVSYTNQGYSYSYGKMKRR